jgi:hypothetical protein
MATIDYTGSSVTTAPPPCPHNQMGHPAVLYRRLNVADIIASNATMTANGYITADDIVQAIHIPVGFFFQHALWRIITPCTATVQLEVGLAGGAEAVAANLADAAAGIVYTTITSDTYGDGDGFYFKTADTIDVQFTVANCVVGDVELFVIGYMLELGE